MYMHKLYNMHVAEDEDILKYINKMKSMVEEINSRNDPDLEINDKTFSSVLMQSLPARWDQFVDSLHHANHQGRGPIPMLNIVHLMHNLKDECYRHGGRKSDEDLNKDQINLSVTPSVFIIASSIVIIITELDCITWVLYFSGQRMPCVTSGQTHIMWHLFPR